MKPRPNSPPKPKKGFILFRPFRRKPKTLKSTRRKRVSEASIEAGKNLATLASGKQIKVDRQFNPVADVLKKLIKNSKVTEATLLDALQKRTPFRAALAKRLEGKTANPEKVLLSLQKALEQGASIPQTIEAMENPA